MNILTQQITPRLRFIAPKVLLIVLTTLTSVMTDLYTSSVKMTELAASEAELLQLVQGDPSLDVNTVTDNLAEDYGVHLRKFAESRQKMISSLSLEERATHPNGAFFLLDAFLREWKDPLDDTPELNQVFSAHRVDLPTAQDLEGAIAGILRLQRVYNISTTQIYDGDYRGFAGPALTPSAAFFIGRHAFSGGFLNQSVDWLNLARDKMRLAVEGTQKEDAYGVKNNNYDLARVTALLGRAHVYRNEIPEAERCFKESQLIDPNCDEMKTLGEELERQPGQNYVVSKEDIPTAMCTLCSRPKNQTVERIRPWHRCRYKPSLLLPYVRYKEEILSLSPYASVFYQVITDTEIEIFKNLLKGQMKPARVEHAQGAGLEGVRSYIRTSDLGWLYDKNEPTVWKLSKRVQDITWLNTRSAHNNGLGPDSAEPFQVLNYGIGGHYNVHVDPLSSRKPAQLQKSGTRIVTFLMYLSDVEMGGYTVFPEAGISVPPVKGSALYWCNVNTVQDVDQRTKHAGCPVIKGHKWVANKWIWTYGNTYRRPCGLKPKSTQYDVERITYSRRQNIIP